MSGEKMRSSGLVTSLQRPARVTKFNRILLDLMVRLLRRGWMGSASDMIMVITTTGRKTGRPHTVPICYLRDDDAVIAVNNEGSSHWIRNVLANGQASLEIKRNAFRARGDLVTDEAERQRIFALYRRDRQLFKASFRLPPDATTVRLQEALSTRWLIRFRPVA